MYSRAQIRTLTFVSKLVGVNGGVWVSFVMPLARQFSFSLEAFRSPLVQDFCPMLSFFFRPRFNRGFGPVRGDPDDMPSYGSSFISLSFHIANMRPVPPVCQIGSRPQSTEAAFTAPGEVPPSAPSPARSIP